MPRLIRAEPIDVVSWRVQGPVTSDIDVAGDAVVQYGSAAGNVAITKNCSWSTSGHYVTVNFPGIYQVNIHLNARSTSSSSQAYEIQISTDGGSTFNDLSSRVVNYTSQGQNIWSDLSFGTVVDLQAGDSLRLVNHYSNSAQADSTYYTGFSGHRVSA